MDSTRSPQPPSSAAERHVAGVVLAAGESRRFGSPKQLALLEGRTLLEHALLNAAEAGLRPIVAVVPVWLTRPAGWTDRNLVWIRNPRPELGMSESLRRGLAAVPAEADAAVILLGDQPRVTRPAIEAVLAARGQTGLVAAHAGGRLAPPVLIERQRFDLAARISGDMGLRDILRRHPDEVTAVEIGTHTPDVDTLDDLERA
jgi:CTP:molybdopterin cytidylyltransferase MocA